MIVSYCQPENLDAAFVVYTFVTIIQIAVINMKNMKKKILFIGLFLVAVVASFRLNTKCKKLEYLILENIEALASGESGNDYRCAGVGSVDCPINHSKVQYVATKYSFEELY